MILRDCIRKSVICILVSTLFIDIERKSAIEKENMMLFEEFQGHLYAEFTNMAAQVSKFHGECADLMEQLKEQEEKTISESNLVIRILNTFSYFIGFRSRKGVSRGRR